jgi:hypothetical protein
MGCLSSEFEYLSPCQVKGADFLQWSWAAQRAALLTSASGRF